MYSFTISSSAGSPTSGSDGMVSALYYGMFNKNMTHVGVAAAYGTMSSGNSSDKDGSMVWGCPETDIYFQYPLNRFNKPISKPTPNSKFKLSTGVAGALVSLVTADFTPIASGYADSDGVIILDIPEYHTSTILTMTARNCKSEIIRYDEVGIINSLKSNKLGNFEINSLISGNNKITLNLSVKEGGLGQIKVIDQKGRVLLNKNTQFTRGVNTISQSGSFSAGVYLVLVRVGDLHFSSKVIIN